MFHCLGMMWEISALTPSQAAIYQVATWKRSGSQPLRLQTDDHTNRRQAPPRLNCDWSIGDTCRVGPVAWFSSRQARITRNIGTALFRSQQLCPVSESLSTINSLIRTGLAVLAVGLIGAGGYYGYRTYNASDLAIQEKEEELVKMRGELAAKQDLLDEQQRQLKVKEQQIQKLDTSLRLLKVNHRVAWLTVLEQEEDPDTKERYTTGQFVEVNDKGEMLGPAAHVPHPRRCGLHRQLDREI